MSLRPAPAAATKTRAELESEQAQAALQQGEALLAAGDAAAALAWLERAERIAHGSDIAALAKAQALLALDDPAAAGEIFARLSRTYDVREIWLALAVTCLRRVATAEAAAALGAALSGHRLPDGDSMFALADKLAAQSGRDGWCGLRSDDSVLVRLATPDAARVEIRADGRRLRGTRVPANAALLDVTRDGRHLLGSPLARARMVAVEGFVAVQDGGLAGWAWLPGDAGRDPVLNIAPLRGGEAMRLTATDTDIPVPRPLMRPRRFIVPAAALARWSGPVRVTGPDGRDLTGSPLDPQAEPRAAAEAAAELARALPVLRGKRGPAPWRSLPADLPTTPASAPARPRRPVAVVVPVYRGLAITQACLAALFATLPTGSDIVVVDDASPEPALRATMADLAAQGRIHLIRHARNRGFPAAANAGLRAAAALAGEADVVLLNSDTLPPPGWLTRLRAAVHAAGDIGTACPLSNDASILSYPDPKQPNPPLQGPKLTAFAALAARVHGNATVDVPTAVGFCMYIRRECLLQTGLLREDVFAQGYGEENDFCLRARRLGWRHVAVPGAYVAHVGGASFGTAATQLRDRNIEVLERLHPGYRALIAAFVAADPLAPARRALDAARWRARPRPVNGSVAIVTHDSGGGVERALRERCAALAARGIGAIVLRPVVDEAGTAGRRYLPGQCRVGDGLAGGYPNLVFRMPDELPALAALLRADAPGAVELHHLLGHHPAVTDLAAALGVPHEIHVHDYSAICLQTNLIGAHRRYCGEPEIAGCVACVAEIGSALEEEIDPAALRRRSAAAIAGARALVAPSHDVAQRLRRYFPTARTVVAPHEDDAALPPLLPMPAGAGPRRIGIVGGIGLAKGYETLLACAQDAAARDLALSFTVIGHTEDDAPLLASGRAFVTGPYAEADAVALIRQQRLHLAWLPSICPETWCYTLAEAMRAGLGVAVFDIGAQAERIRRTGRGWVLPLGLSPPAVNNALLALPALTSDVGAQPNRAPPTSHLRSMTARS